jgi:hypothetical protein
MHYVVWVNGRCEFETQAAPTVHEAEGRLVLEFFVRVVARTPRHDLHKWCPCAYESLATIFQWYMQRVHSARDVFDAMCDLVKHDCGFISFKYEQKSN